MQTAVATNSHKNYQNKKGKTSINSVYQNLTPCQASQERRCHGIKAKICVQKVFMLQMSFCAIFLRDRILRVGRTQNFIGIQNKVLQNNMNAK